MQAAIRVILLPRGERLFDEGDPGDRLYPWSTGRSS